MKNIKIHVILFLSILLMLTACSQTNLVEQGTPLSKDKVSQIVEGATTDSQVLDLLGEPTSRTVINSSDVQWTYKYTRKNSTSNMLFGETQYNIVEGTLDMVISKGVVTWYNYTENNKQKKW